MQKKNKSISMIFSNKGATVFTDATGVAPGHGMRHKLWREIQGLGLVDGCGNGAGKYINNKTECLV
jgi:hypothetical protein